MNVTVQVGMDSIPTEEVEIWKDIPGYEGRYQASTLGRIKSLSRIEHRINRRTGKTAVLPVNERILRPGRFNVHGHVSVVLRRAGQPKGVGKPVHQLVMLTFVGPPPKDMEVCHYNDIPTDNRLINLRYGTHSENGIDRYTLAQKGNKLTVQNVREIRQMLDAGYTRGQLARRFHVSGQTIYNIKLGVRFPWVK
jgi:DNA-binding XRE family transcriptional regulator